MNNNTYFYRYHPFTLYTVVNNSIPATADYPSKDIIPVIIKSVVCDGSLYY